jgi:hypothetical protein
MARKPPTELRDVFARPGQAPERNTAIEDLPKPADPVASQPAEPGHSRPASAKSYSPTSASGVSARAAAEPDAADLAPAEWDPHAPVAADPGVPDPAAPDSVPVAADTAASAAETEPAPPPRDAAPRPRPPARPASERAVTMLAAAALLVALVAPVLEDDLLGYVGILTPAARAQQETALMLSRQQQKLRDLEQRLTEAVSQLAATNAELQQSALRGTDAAAWGRLLSLGRVADDLRGATPFASDLAVVQTVGAQNGGGPAAEFQADFAALSAYAGTGIPTLAELDREFRRIADETLRPGRGILPAGLVRRLTIWNQSGGSSASPSIPIPDLVQAASARLADGDLEEAVASIRQITGTYQGAFAGWLQDAQARVNADALVRRIDRTLAGLARELPQ